MAMDQCLDILKSSFPLINEDICSYVQSVLETSGEDFESPDDLFEAILGMEVNTDWLKDENQELGTKFLIEVATRLHFTLPDTK